MLLCAVVLLPAAAYAQGSTRTEDLDITNPVDYITFNQYSNNAIWGDEHDFVRVSPILINPLDATHEEMLTLQNGIVANEGQEYYLYLYVHNNAAGSLGLVAENVKVQISKVDDVTL
jgi:hypothetical protein